MSTCREDSKKHKFNEQAWKKQNKKQQAFAIQESYIHVGGLKLEMWTLIRRRISRIRVKTTDKVNWNKIGIEKKAF